MELYLEPQWAKKDTRFKKGHATWNKGRKGYTTDNPEKRRVIDGNLERGRKIVWKTRPRDVVWNSIPVSVYDLDGHYLSSHKSVNAAAQTYGVQPRNARYCLTGSRDRAGMYMFRKANIITFKGETLVKKENIEPYKRRNRKRECPVIDDKQT